MRESGGLLYFLRGARFRNTLWLDYRDQTKRFLEKWNPESKSLLLVGPSAGFSLPAEFLNRFERITAIEPDPIARMLFEKRFNLKPTWIRKALDFEKIESLYPLRNSDSAILFCNLLGQIPFSNVSKVRQNLKTALVDQEWASYHDALSGREIEFDLEELHPGKATLSQINNLVYVKSRTKTEIEINAHQAFELFDKKDALQFSYWQWRILPNRTHLIEGVFKKC